MLSALAPLPQCIRSKKAHQSYQIAPNIVAWLRPVNLGVMAGRPEFQL